MPAFHSSFTDNKPTLGNMALLPIKTNYRGPAPPFTGKDMDIIDEALYYFKANDSLELTKSRAKLTECSSISRCTSQSV